MREFDKWNEQMLPRPARETLNEYSTLRNLCVLCVSAVKRNRKQVNRRDAEITQRDLLIARSPRAAT